MTKCMHILIQLPNNYLHSSLTCQVKQTKKITIWQNSVEISCWLCAIFTLNNGHRWGCESRTLPVVGQSSSHFYLPKPNGDITKHGSASLHASVSHLHGLSIGLEKISNSFSSIKNENGIFAVVLLCKIVKKL